MKMRSQMDDTCAPSYSPHGPAKTRLLLLLLLQYLYSRLIVFELINV
jgi:hypothetical protein